MATVPELKKELDKKGIEYKASATKPELEALLNGGSEEGGVVDAASSETGENTDGVMSPHSGVGEKVPGDLVPPGHKVDPRTGAVIEGAGTDLATPRPNPRDPGKPVSAKPGQEWAGNHTV